MRFAPKTWSGPRRVVKADWSVMMWRPSEVFPRRSTCFTLRASPFATLDERQLAHLTLAMLPGWQGHIDDVARFYLARDQTQADVLLQLG